MTGIVGLIFFSFSHKSSAFSDLYTQDEQGLHVRVTGKTETGDSWTLREYRPKDFEAHWRIITENTGRNKLYPLDVTAGNKESVKDRREKSIKRFSMGNPWGVMSLLNEDNVCVFIFGLGRRTGSEGAARFGHGHLGLTQDPKEAHKGYRKSLLNVIKTVLAPEIRRLGEDPQVPQEIRYNFTHKDSLTEKEGPLETGSLTHIDLTFPPYLNDMREEAFATGFKYDTEGAIDFRTETHSLRNSAFETLEKDILDQFKDNFIEFQRYIITGPKGEDAVIWYSPKWEGIKLCFVYEVNP